MPRGVNYYKETGTDGGGVERAGVNLLCDFTDLVQTDGILLCIGALSLGLMHPDFLLPIV
jgi:hypothetical protein